MMKKAVLIMLGIFLLLTIVPSAYALEIDNVKSYKPTTATVKNLFGFGETIANVTLKTPEVMYVFPGSDVLVAEFELNLFEDYDKPLKEIEFLDLKKSKLKINRDFEFKYKEYYAYNVTDYYQSCETSYLANSSVVKDCVNVANGTHEEFNFVWKNLDRNAKLDSGVYEIGIFTNVKNNERIEWIPTFMGVEIDEWAVWDSSMDVNLETYFHLNNTLTNMIPTSNNLTNTGCTGSDTDGLYGGHYYCGDNNAEKLNMSDWIKSGSAYYTLNLWVYPTSQNANNNYIARENTDANLLVTYLGEGNLYVGNSVSGCQFSNAPMVANKWAMITIAQANTIRYVYHNGTLVGNCTYVDDPDGTDDMLFFGADSNRALNGRGDEIALWNETKNASFINSLWASGLGVPRSIPVPIIPTVTLNNPDDTSVTDSTSVTFNCSAVDNSEIVNITLMLNGAFNYSEAFSGTNDTSIEVDRTLAEGNYNYSCYAIDDDSYQGNSTIYNFSVDLNSPVISSIQINQSGTFWGYPQSFAIELNVSDLTLASCWGNIDNGANQSLTCNSFTGISTVEEGSHTFYGFANDSIGRTVNISLPVIVDYYTHNVTFYDLINSTKVITPNCSYNSLEFASYPYYFDIHATVLREVTCTEEGYDSMMFNLTESNFTSQNATFVPAYLNLTFSESTNARIIWLGGGLNYSNITTILLTMNTLPVEKIRVVFNDETQLISFDNTAQMRSFVKNLLVESVDYDQSVKVLAGSSEVYDALVEFKKNVGGILKTTYSTFTDLNGMSHIILIDGTIYEIHVLHEDYQNYSSTLYIPPSNTETVLINLLSSTTETVPNYYFSPSCLREVGTAQNCSFYVQTFTDKNITFNYTWNGQFYSVTSYGTRANLTLWVNSTTTPIYVNVSVNPTETYTISFEDVGERDIQALFDVDDINDETIGVKTLFYAIIFIIGILIMVTVNQIPRMEGNGLYGMIIWWGVLAIWFPLLWFVVIPVGVYAVIKRLWGDSGDE